MNMRIGAPYRGLGSVNPLELANVHASQIDLDNCGAPVHTTTPLFLELPKSYLYTLSWQLDAVNAQYFSDERRPVASVGDFFLDRVVLNIANGVRLRFVWPNGRFSSNTRIPALSLSSLGDQLLTFASGVLIPGGQWIGIDFEIDANTAAGSFTIGFEGRTRYYLKESAPTRGRGRITR